jgi:hypothetical protein
MENNDWIREAFEKAHREGVSGEVAEAAERFRSSLIPMILSLGAAIGLDNAATEFRNVSETEYGRLLLQCVFIAGYISGGRKAEKKEDE